MSKQIPTHTTNPFATAPARIVRRAAAPPEPPTRARQWGEQDPVGFFVEVVQGGNDARCGVIGERGGARASAWTDLRMHFDGKVRTERSTPPVTAGGRLSAAEAVRVARMSGKATSPAQVAALAMQLAEPGSFAEVLCLAYREGGSSSRAEQGRSGAMYLSDRDHERAGMRKIEVPAHIREAMGEAVRLRRLRDATDGW